MKKLAILSAAFLFLAACSKEPGGKAPTPADLGNLRTESSARATFILNLDLDGNVSSSVPTGICAQVVQHNSGQYKGLKVIEVSQGPCSNDIVDDSKNLVEVFRYNFFGSSNEIEILSPGDKRIGLAEFYSLADKEKLEARKVKYLCNGSFASLCTINTTQVETFGGIEIH